MGTRADFYVGRGEQAEWLGSIAWDGNPKGIHEAVLRSMTETEFRGQVREFLSQREDRSLPEDGWPWPWENSRTTDYAYAFDGGAVYASCFGREWFDPTKPRPDQDDLPKTALFPDMSGGKRRELFGAHSGVMVLRG
jgi:hypothetical protein